MQNCGSYRYKDKSAICRRNVTQLSAKRVPLVIFIAVVLVHLNSMFALAAIRDPVFSIPDGTVLSSPRQLAISVPFDGEVRFTRDGTTPGPASTLYSGPLLIRWSETIRAVAIVGSSSSNVVSASYTLSSTKFPPPSSGGTTPPVINLQSPTPAQ
ncbi:MAG: chitobiase/beta-hexosaminidase C-terminal domain-containing protein [Candidatus Obscuribacterales bacterium]